MKFLESLRVSKSLKGTVENLLKLFIILFCFFLLFPVFVNAQSIVPELQGIYNSFSLNFWNLAIVNENGNYAVGLRIFDENVRSETYKLGFISMKRRVDRSYFNLLAFVGQIYGVALTIGYENFSIPSTGFERTYYISTNETMQTDYSKTWFTIPAIPLGEGSFGPISLNYEGFSLKRLGDGTKIDIKRGFATIDVLQLSFVQIGNIYSLGFFVLADKSMEQGATVNIGWDLDESRLIGVLGGRIFIDVLDMRFFFSAYGTYIPSSQNLKYAVWFRFLSPLEGDLIIQNNAGYFKLKINTF